MMTDNGQHSDAELHSSAGSTNAAGAPVVSRTASRARNAASPAGPGQTAAYATAQPALAPDAGSASGWALPPPPKEWGAIDLGGIAATLPAPGVYPGTSAPH
jgi:hypothetical protein